MKKFLIMLTALALVCAFGIPAGAGDAPWSFYGSGRMSTFYNSDADRAGAIDPDDTGTIWSLQGNSRIGARVSGDTISGRFEYGSGPNLRILYGAYHANGHEFLVGQTYTPLGSMFPSSQVFGGDAGLLDVGFVYNGRRPMLQWKYEGLRIALINAHAVNDLGTGGDTDSTIPKAEIRYNFKTDTFFADVFGGYQTYAIDGQAPADFDDDVTSYVVGLGGGVNFGPGYFKGQVNWMRNAGPYGLWQEGNDDPVVVAGSLVDNDGFGIGGVIGFKATDTLAFEGGIGYTAFELDTSGANTDDTISYYLQATIDIAPGFFIVPEVGYYDYGEGHADDSDQGSKTYFGAKWQINF